MISSEAAQKAGSPYFASSYSVDGRTSQGNDVTALVGTKRQFLSLNRLTK